MGLIFLGSVEAASDATMASVAQQAGSLFRQALLPLVQDAIADDTVIAGGVRNLMFRGDLPNGTDLDRFGAYENNGSWRITSSGHTNGPGLTASGVLEVIRQPGPNGAVSVLQRVTDQTGMWWREAVDYGTYSWGFWKRVATTDDLSVARGEVPDGADLNTYRTRALSGSYSIFANRTYLNAPTIDAAGVFEVIVISGTTYSALQRITTQTSSWWREAVDVGVNQWGLWKRVATIDDVGAGGTGGELGPATIAYSESADRKTTYVHGDVDHLMEYGVGSITKMFTTWTARQYLTDAELDGTATVEAGDMSDSPHLKVGDVVTFRDLIHTAMINSDSTAPGVLARTIGAKIDPASSTPRAVFLAAMEAEAERLGYHGAKFPMAISAAQVSARHIMDLFRRYRADPQIGAIPSKKTYTVTVVGGPDPRTYDITHTIGRPSAPALPEFVAGKTGTAGGRAHVVVQWKHPDGTDHVTVILNTREATPNQRYIDLRTIINATSAETMPVLGYPGHLREYIQEQVTEIGQAPTNTVVDGRISAQKAQPNGLATLDGDGWMPLVQVPLQAVVDAPAVKTAIRTGVEASAGINVREYGAKGDGVTDDTAAILAAQTVAAAGNRTLFFPNGRYLYSQTLTAQSIRGENRQRTILQYTGTVAAIGVRAPVAQSYHRRIEDLTLQGPGVGVGIDIDSSSAGMYSRLLISQFDRAVDLRSSLGLPAQSLYNTFMDVTASNMNGYAFRLDNVSNENRFIACRVNFALRGFQINSGGRNAIIECSIEEITERGVSLLDSEPGMNRSRGNIISSTRFENSASTTPWTAISIGTGVAMTQVLNNRIISPAGYTDNGTGTLLLHQESGAVVAARYATSARPTVPVAGAMIFDITLGKPIWWSGTAWKDAAGATV